MTLLTVAQDVADEIAIVRPTMLVGSADVTARRFLQVANAAGNSLARAANWAILHRQYEFTTVADTSNYAVPDDWHRGMGNTAWDRTSFRQMRGNRTPAEWQRLQSGVGATSSFSRSYRLVVGPQAGSIIIEPTPGATGDELVIEYVSSFWCEDALGNGQLRFAADTDNIRIDHELFRMGLLWRAKRALGLDYADERADYDVALRDAVAADLNLRTVNTGGGLRYDPGSIVPEGNWNL